MESKDIKQKYQCVCGSSVLKANQKQHEKTKKHMNVVNPGSVKAKQRHEPEEEEDYDEVHDLPEDNDEDQWEDEVSELLETLIKQVVQGNKAILDQLKDNLQVLSSEINNLKNSKDVKHVQQGYINEKCQ